MRCSRGCGSDPDLPRHLGQHRAMVICQGRLDASFPPRTPACPAASSCGGGRAPTWGREDRPVRPRMAAVLHDRFGDQRLPPGGGAAARVVEPAARRPGGLLDAARRHTIGVFQVESRADGDAPRLTRALLRPGRRWPPSGRGRSSNTASYPNRHAGLRLPAPVARADPRALGVPLFQSSVADRDGGAGFTGTGRGCGGRSFRVRAPDEADECSCADGAQGITGQAAEDIVRRSRRSRSTASRVTRPASRCWSTRAYLKAHYPAAFYAALLNNWLMVTPATLVRTLARRPLRASRRAAFALALHDRGGRRHPPRVLLREGSEGRWEAIQQRTADSRQPTACHAGHARRADRRESAFRPPPPSDRRRAIAAPSAWVRRQSMLEVSRQGGRLACFCNNCAHDWKVVPPRFRSVDELIARTGINREELSTLAEAGALASLGFTRREALWQVERAIRPAGELFEGRGDEPVARRQAGLQAEPEGEGGSPLPEMTPVERLVADYEGTGLTIGPHPMAMRREEMETYCAADHRPRSSATAGARRRRGHQRQRPNAAKGFVFLTLGDETGIANIIVGRLFPARARRWSASRSAGRRDPAEPGRWSGARRAARQDGRGEGDVEARIY